MDANTDVIVRRDKKYLVRCKLYLDQQEKVFDFTPVIEFIQYNGTELITKIFRQIHHNYACLNIEEMTEALNSKKITLGSYSESIPAELYFLKEISDCVEAIQEVQIP